MSGNDAFLGGFGEKVKCPCGCGGGIREMDSVFLQILRDIEMYLDTRLQITSGFRCRQHNQSVGGVNSSSHIFGVAVDVAVTGSRARFHVIDAAILCGINRIGVYPQHVHLDHDKKKSEAIWIGGDK